MNDDNNGNGNGNGDDFSPIIGGLNSGGLLVERGGDPVRATSGPIQATELVARTPEGFRISNHAELADDSIVTLADGTETNFATAKMLGLMPGAPSGSSDAPQRQDQQQDETQQQQEQQDQGTGNPKLDPQSEEWLGKSLDNSVEATVFAAADILAKDGEITVDAVENIAAANGIEPEEARQRIAHVLAAMDKEAVVESARSVGTSEEVAREALQAARVDRASALREAADQHFRSGRPGYEGFLKDYIANLDQVDPNRILQANPVPGRKVHWSGEHRCIVVTDTTSGATYRWQDAVYLGLIGFK